MNKDDICPVCGESIYLRHGQTKDGRLIGSCGDTFTQSQWEACPKCGNAPNNCSCDEEN